MVQVPRTFGGTRLRLSTAGKGACYLGHGYGVHVDSSLFHSYKTSCAYYFRQLAAWCLNLLLDTHWLEVVLFF